LKRMAGNTFRQYRFNRVKWIRTVSENDGVIAAICGRRHAMHRPTFRRCGVLKLGSWNCWSFCLFIISYMCISYNIFDVFFSRGAKSALYIAYYSADLQSLYAQLPRLQRWSDPCSFTRCLLLSGLSAFRLHVL